MINKVPEKIIVSPQNHELNQVQQKPINAQTVYDPITPEFEKEIENVLTQHSISVGIVSTVFITGGWFYIFKHIQDNKLNSINLTMSFVLAILTLAQLIIWITYFVFLVQKDDVKANTILGEWSVPILSGPLLSLLCLIILSMFGVINKI